MSITSLTTKGHIIGKSISGIIGLGTLAATGFFAYYYNTDKAERKVRRGLFSAAWQPVDPKLTLGTSRP